MSSTITNPLFNTLPPETMLHILSYLLPHQLTGLTLSSRRSMEFTDQSVHERIPSRNKTPTADGATLRWVRNFRKLPIDLQDAIEATFGSMPLWNANLPVGHRTRDLLLATASVHRYAQGGVEIPSVRFIGMVDSERLKARRDSPSLNEAVQKCWKAVLREMMARAEEHASRGSEIPTLSFVEMANKVAIKAGRPFPDTSGVLRRCWEVRLGDMTKKAEEYARRGLDVPTMCCIEKANEAAVKAGYPQLDSSGLMRTCWEVKLGDAVAEKAEECALQCFHFPLQVAS